MRSGTLRHRVDVEVFTAFGTGTRGEPEGEWIPAHWGVPVSIDTLDGKEVQISRQLVPTATHAIGLRYLDGLTTAHRLKFGERVFAIGHVENIEERNGEMKLLVTEEK